MVLQQLDVALASLVLQQEDLVVLVSAFAVVVALADPPQHEDVLVTASLLMDVLPQPQSLVTAVVASVVLGVLLQHEDFVALVSVFALVDPPQHDDFAAVVAGALFLLAPPQQEDDDDVGVTSGRFGSVFMFGSLGFVGPTSCRSGRMSPMREKGRARRHGSVATSSLNRFKPSGATQ